MEICDARRRLPDAHAEHNRPVALFLRRRDHNRRRYGSHPRRAHALTPNDGIASKATMDGRPRKTFVEDGPFAKPEAAARELLRIYRDRLKDGAPYTMTGVTNTEFIYTSGGSPANYRAGL